MVLRDQDTFFSASIPLAGVTLEVGMLVPAMTAKGLYAVIYMTTFVTSIDFFVFWHPPFTYFALYCDGHSVCTLHALSVFSQRLSSQPM